MSRNFMFVGLTVDDAFLSCYLFIILKHGILFCIGGSDD